MLAQNKKYSVVYKISNSIGITFVNKSNFTTCEDPIIASSVLPTSAISLVRISFGRMSEYCVRRLFLGQVVQVVNLVPRHAYYTPIFDSSGNRIDSGVLLLFVAPHSYTGDCVMEFYGHSCFEIVQAVVTRCLEVGCAFHLRHAEAGEFTKRAYANSKISLLQASYVGQSSWFYGSLKVQSSANYSSLIADLFGLYKRLCHFVQTSEFASSFNWLMNCMEDVRHIFKSVKHTCRLIVAKAKNSMSNQCRICVVGLPNVGKSLLFNSIVQHNCAVVSNWQGTTRDAIKQDVVWNSTKLDLLDTAGIYKSQTKVNNQSIDRTLNLLASVNCIVQLISPFVPCAFQITTPSLFVVNKLDQLFMFSTKTTNMWISQFEIVSAKRSWGIKQLRRQLIVMLHAHNRLCKQTKLLQLVKWLAARCDVMLMLNSRDWEECASQTHNLVKCIAVILGLRVSARTVCSMFSRFCVGK